MMIIQGVRPTLAGLAVGIAGAVLMSQAIAGLLFQVSPTDPLTFATVPLIIAASGILAAWLPARRACRIDPVIALRPE
jgi:ABC-type antimicrobial peptide transport system permease subunit